MQRVLDLQVKSAATFSNFIVGANALTIESLKLVAEGRGDNYMYIWSQTGEGLSHLLQATCEHATQHAIENIYLPLAELKACGPDFLHTIHEFPVVCIDDIHLVAGEDPWEEALFHAFNRVKECQHRLLLGGHRAVAECGFQLPDLTSRLAWGAAYLITPLRDQEKILLLQQAGQRRGFHLPEEVAYYLLARYPRDMQTQRRILEKLDLLSLQEKHKITLPFVRAKLESF